MDYAELTRITTRYVESLVESSKNEPAHVAKLDMYQAFGAYLLWVQLAGIEAAPDDDQRLSSLVGIASTESR